jgi:hypothetical protein
MAVPARNARRVAITYFATSVLWFLLVDQLLCRLFQDSARIAPWQMMSGYFWAGLTSLALLFHAQAAALELSNITFGYINILK